MAEQSFECPIPERPATWVLVDRRPGNAGQAMGVARALGLPFEVKRLEYTRLIALPTVLKGRSMMGVAASSRAALAPPWPDVVVAAGRRAALVARVIKHASGSRCALVQLMHPGIGADEFDVIAVPEHDRCAPGANLVRTLCAPTDIARGRLAAEAARWRERLDPLPRPRIGLLVGAPVGGPRASRSASRTLIAEASAMARRTGGSLLVTTSRRTGSRLAELIARGLDVPHHCHRWRRGAENPYLAYLALCDGFVVTGDSVSMCSEACGTGRPVYVAAGRGWAGPAQRRFHDLLYARGIARPFDGAFEPWSYPPVDAAKEVANAVRRRLAMPEADRAAPPDRSRGSVASYSR